MRPNLGVHGEGWRKKGKREKWCKYILISKSKVNVFKHLWVAENRQHAHSEKIRILITFSSRFHGVSLLLIIKSIMIFKSFILLAETTWMSVVSINISVISLISKRSLSLFYILLWLTSYSSSHSVFYNKDTFVLGILSFGDLFWSAFCSSSGSLFILYHPQRQQLDLCLYFKHLSFTLSYCNLTIGTYLFFIYFRSLLYSKTRKKHAENPSIFRFCIFYTS